MYPFGQLHLVNLSALSCSIGVAGVVTSARIVIEENNTVEIIFYLLDYSLKINGC
jgi:hypothetical protein